MSRHPRVLTTMDEDFRRIGLLPQKQLTEMDDPSQPRDVPSPDPSTLAGLDDSEGEKSAHQAGAKQPRPKLGPDDDDSDVLDPAEDGGGTAVTGAKGGYVKVAGGKEASLKGESKYETAKKQPMKTKKAGQKAKIAQGLKPAKKMVGEGKFGKAASLIEEVEGLLRGVQIDEEVDNLMRGFSLVAEDAALLADRLTEIADRYQVNDAISEMEELSRDAAEAIAVIEAELEADDDAEEDAAVAHSSAAAEMEGVESDRDAEEPYDVPSPAFKEQAEQVLGVMVKRLMDTLESYDGCLDDMNEGMDYEGDEEDEGKMMVNDAEDDDAPAPQVHHHFHHNMDAKDGEDGDGDADDQDADADHDDDDAAGDDGDQDADDQGDDADHGGLAARMKELRARREALKGKSFPAAQ